MGHILGALFLFFIVFPAACEVVITLLGWMGRSRPPGHWREWGRTCLVLVFWGPLIVLTICGAVWVGVPALLHTGIWLFNRGLLIPACIGLLACSIGLLVRQHMTRPRDNTRNVQ